MSEESAIKRKPLVIDAEQDIETLAEEKNQLKSLKRSYELWK